MFSITERDLEWQFFRAGGKGGQAQNKTSSGARVIHRESGARGESRIHRDQLHNRRTALKALADSVQFRTWVAEQHAEVERTESLAQQVARMLDSSNLRVEVKEDGRWVEE